ncbi:hypothetical protein [Tenacibaculum ovolyticum]|uniref:hypothetical protein n=1 Tax=Tenacibaculum ovolyticum TaxID=104270 RepID=UPI000414D1F8|nr:hypothetical protein [Tenacibaculum ovolyticum]
MKKKIILITVLLACLISTQCTKLVDKKDFDYGKVENNVYSNSFFDFKMEVPSGWIVQTKEQTDKIREIGKKVVIGEDKNLEAIVKASEVNSAYLLTVFQHEVGAAVEYNPGFMLLVENLDFAPGIKTGADYLFNAKKLLKQSKIEYQGYDNEIEEVEINKQNFYVMSLSIEYAGVNIKQKYFTTIRNGFSINLIMSFVDDNQKEILEKTLKTFKFKDKE